MRNVNVYPYRMASRSGRALAQELDVKRVREASPTFRPTGRHVINWGNPRLPAWNVIEGNWLNSPDAVAQCSNKLLFFQMLHEHGRHNDIPEFTSDVQLAAEWGQAVIARTHLNGSGGLGAHYVENAADLLAQLDNPLRNAPLFVKYFKKKAEYRVHFGPLGVFHVQHKRKRLEEQDADFRIRNHDNGWVFTINDVNPPAAVMDVCNRVIPILPLDFGALDVVYNEHYDRALVLEVNTACGLEGTTLTKYADMFREVLR